jgi:hypothetical protein
MIFAGPARKLNAVDPEATNSQWTNIVPMQIGPPSACYHLSIIETATTKSVEDSHMLPPGPCFLLESLRLDVPFRQAFDC